MTGRATRRRLIKFAKIALIVLSGLVVVALVAKHVLVDQAPVPATSTYRVHMPTLRRLAGSLRGPLPLEINAVVTARANVPAGAVVAGRGMGDHEMIRTAYQIVYPEATVLIDAAVSRALHEEMFAGDPFYPEKFTKLQRALHASEAVFITHTHPDHIGGIVGAQHPEKLLGKLRWTEEQVDNRAQLERAHFPPELVSRIPVLHYEQYRALYPGLVAIKAPGHTPGSQMFYVKTQGGEEYLFVGDIAWHMDNVTQLTGRPYGVARFILGEDRDAVLEQLRTLHDLRQAEPSLHLVVSHDAEQLAGYVKAGLLGSQLK